MDNPIPAVTLPSGIQMPAIGFGVFRMDDLATCEKACSDALSAGYRFLDTATAYGNEEAVGAAISKSGIPREDLFISTKLWVTDASYERARPAFERSLERLGLDYVDLYIIHQPYGDVFGAWRALAELKAEGRIRALGVDNMRDARLADFLAFTDGMPDVDFIEVNPLCQQRASVAYMQQRGVQPMAWGPLGSGNAAALLADPLLARIADAHGKSVAQIMLRWLVQRGIVPVAKSTNPERMRQNLDVFGFALTDEEMLAISLLDTDVSSADRRTGAQVERFLNIALGNGLAPHK